MENQNTSSQNNAGLIVCVAALRASQTDEEFEFKGLDPLGAGTLGEILTEIEPDNRGTVFAVAASMFAAGQPVYYSYGLNAISTDATFGATPSKVPNFQRTGALPVVSVDGIWMLRENSGTLIMTFESGAVVPFGVNEVGPFIGWLHLIGVDLVTFDGERLATAKLKTWEADDFLP